MKTYALIPCRKGSKGIPNKNFREIANQPLWYWTVDAALGSEVFDKIILSSDGGGFNNVRILQDENGPIIFDNHRPEQYATDEATLDDLLYYYYKKYDDAELWCLLQPTSPLRRATDIRKAYKMAIKEKYDSVVSVIPDPMMYWVKNATSQGHLATYHVHKRPNRQQRKDFYRETGAIYFVKSYVIEMLGLRVGGTIGLCTMPKLRAIEIDDMDDWKIAEFLLNGQK